MSLVYCHLVIFVILSVFNLAIFLYPVWQRSEKHSPSVVKLLHQYVDK